jgi:hypothetical protein
MIDDDWLDAELLADDPPSKRDWRTKARGGKTRTEAMALVPTRGQFTLQLPMHVHRAIRRYLRERDENTSQFLRRAIETELRSRGHWDDDEYRDLHD